MSLTVEQLLEHFTKDSGGPNPFYRCVKCGAVEPGVVDYLNAHVESCPNFSVKYTAECHPIPAN
jgi:hypothetical protein